MLRLCHSVIIFAVHFYFVPSCTINGFAPAFHYRDGRSFAERSFYLIGSAASAAIAEVDGGGVLDQNFPGKIISAHIVVMAVDQHLVPLRTVYSSVPAVYNAYNAACRGDIAFDCVVSAASGSIIHSVGGGSVGGCQGCDAERFAKGAGIVPGAGYLYRCGAGFFIVRVGHRIVRILLEFCGAVFHGGGGL